MYRNSFLCVLVTVLFFIIGFSHASGHVNFGEYAGTHAVAFVPEPRSPFVGEEVSMTFYIRDLHGYFPEEPFVVVVILQSVLQDDGEYHIFTTSPDKIKNGIYKTSHQFSQSGLYRVEFAFHKQNEPEIIREAIFDIQVRDIPDSFSPLKLLTVFLLIAFPVFLTGVFLGRFHYKKTP